VSAICYHANHNEAFDMHGASARSAFLTLFVLVSVSYHAKAQSYLDQKIDSNIQNWVDPYSVNFLS
jgi:hypothetical protein